MLFDLLSEVIISAAIAIPKSSSAKTITIKYTLVDR
jgi:hypothetical protein